MNERILKTLIKQDELFQCFAIGRDIGEARGIQKQHDMILEIYKKGLPINLISDISKLSEVEVKEIINNTNTKEKSWILMIQDFFNYLNINYSSFLAKSSRTLLVAVRIGETEPPIW